MTHRAIIPSQSAIAAHANLGHARFQLEDFAAAEQHYLRALELAPGQDSEGGDLALRVGAVIEGTVLTPEGDPLPGKRVSWGSNAMGFGNRDEATSDAAGRFHFEHVTPGTWSVSASPSINSSIRVSMGTMAR